MNGVTITRKVIPPASSNRVGDALAIAALVILGLLLLPLLWLAMFGSWLRDRLVPHQTDPSIAVTEWHTVDTDSVLLLRYQYVQAEAISAAAEGYFEQELLLRYQADPPLPFFNGYFTDFRVTRADGLFVQKIHFDAELTEMLAMPLYFFCYQTQEAEELLELQEYELETKGRPDNFILKAISEHEELHIQFVRK